MTTIERKNVTGRVIIEALNPEIGNWDSDYISNESTTLTEAEEYITELRRRAETDPVSEGDGNINTADGVSWRGWSFRIVAERDGAYDAVVEMAPAIL